MIAKSSIQCKSDTVSQCQGVTTIYISPEGAEKQLDLFDDISPTTPDLNSLPYRLRIKETRKLARQRKEALRQARRHARNHPNVIAFEPRKER